MEEMVIYLKTKGQHLLILEPANIERIQKGEPAKSPNNEVAVAYTPDLVWLTEQLKGIDEMDVEKLDTLLKESLKRPAVHRRPYHTPELFVIPAPDKPR